MSDEYENKTGYQAQSSETISSRSIQFGSTIEFLYHNSLIPILKSEPCKV